MVCVFPGCALVRASDLRFISALIREDFPTLDFPANATSIFVFAGNTLVIPHTVSNATFFITIRFSCFLQRSAISAYESVHYSSSAFFFFFPDFFSEIFPVSAIGRISSMVSA